jgi:SAM-dependent methyltransferase
LDWLTYVLRKFFPAPIERAVSLGCGEGGLERHALSVGAVDLFDAYDASEGAIQNARRHAEIVGHAQGVRYSVRDVNRFSSPGRIYDAAFASMSIHHIEALESVFDELRKSLKPTGLFVMNEYIGPTKFQLPPAQLTLINDLLGILPARYRRMIRDGARTNEIKQEHHIHPLEWFERYDPSEAVRSADLLSVLQDYFEIVEIKSYGGTLLHFLLENIVGNFDNSKEEDRAWLRMLEYFETTLEKGAMIDNDFAVIVARPRLAFY